ncbi:MAG TPA: hypothetical protein PKI00_02475 [Candidatus Pacearchaeota archaeon]|nr:hypothetical protein [Candidatus Pacearchaeota archaeon]HOC53725.1 hypothetical protein [Candidatus Pacearchaeota archaeon]HQM24735.1 hypothetical protein [Candidatus Pacearchaeota archaeon]
MIEVNDVLIFEICTVIVAAGIDYRFLRWLVMGKRKFESRITDLFLAKIPGILTILAIIGIIIVLMPPNTIVKEGLNFPTFIVILVAFWHVFLLALPGILILLGLYALWRIFK